MPGVFCGRKAPLSGRCQRKPLPCLLSDSRCNSFSSNSTSKIFTHRVLGERPRSAPHQGQRLWLLLGGACWSGLSPFVRLKSMAVCRSGCRTKKKSRVESSRCSIFRSAPTAPKSLRCRKCCGGGCIDPAKVLFERQGLPGNSSTGDVPRETASAFAQSSFGAYRDASHAAGTLKASGGDLGGGSESLVIGTLTARDAEKQFANNQAVDSGMLIVCKKSTT